MPNIVNMLGGCFDGWRSYLEQYREPLFGCIALVWGVMQQGPGERCHNVKVLARVA